MWSVYQVAFVDVEDGRLGQLMHQGEWGVGQPIPHFHDVVGELQTAMGQARRDGVVPRSSSVSTCHALQPVVTRVLEDHGFGFDGFERGSPAFWWWHPVDMLYRQKGAEATVGIEVKVDEDWEHPFNQPLAGLLAHAAVITIRIPTQGERLDPKMRQLVTEAETRLAATGRATFMAVT